MWTLYTHTSPSSTRAKLSRRLTFPSRIALTSVPTSCNTRLERFENVVVVKRLAVLGDAFLRLFAFGFHLQRFATHATLVDDSRTASFIASIRLDGSATPLPAMSNAVP